MATQESKNRAAVALGRRGGRAGTEAQNAARRANGAKGGRPCSCARRFRDDNTEGYSAAELEALNAELAGRLDGIPHDEHEPIVKAFCDEVAGR